MAHEPAWCPVMRPTKAEFQRPFQEYVADVFAKDPSLPMFKVVPPASWSARTSCFPDLENVHINTPIRQNVFGSKGAYRCFFVENDEVNVESFKELCRQEDTRSKAQVHRAEQDDDGLLERQFWSNVTLNPPLYGADTPLSFFEPSWGWNLKKLNDLLTNHDLPTIPGVTSPMTYFGMWRSFFGWHKEDADLLSINYLHFGAPKTWYCVSPKDQAKFERMAAGLFPQLHDACNAFIRHKDILMSPSLLRAHGIPFMQAKQKENEFIVLNAAAYHSGFNMGFNCAEAINFATPAWVEAGKAAVPCRCRPDNVRINMKLFDPSFEDSDDEDANAPWRRGGKKRQRHSVDGGSVDGEGQPFATLAEDKNGDKFFSLVQQIRRPARNPANVVCRWLKEGPDGLFRPESTYWEEKPDSLIKVRTQYLAEGSRSKARNGEAGAEAADDEALRGGWKLLTLRSKILKTELR